MCSYEVLVSAVVWSFLKADCDKLKIYTLARKATTGKKRKEGDSTNKHTKNIKCNQKYKIQKRGKRK